MKELTFGQKRVGLSFNPSQDSSVSNVKQQTAEIIDYMQAVRNDECSKTYDESPEVLQQKSGEKLRLISLAQTAYEEACMWAVKAITYEN